VTKVLATSFLSGFEVSFPAYENCYRETRCNSTCSYNALCNIFCTGSNRVR